MTMDELVAQASVDSRDIAAVFDMAHDLILDEIDDRREHPDCNQNAYIECWDSSERHVVMTLADMAWLVQCWPISQVAEFQHAYGRLAAKGACLGF